MTSPVQPPSVTDDAGRLAALHDYAILDTPAETAFDDIVRLACQICRTSSALVSFVTDTRQWFKARIGFPDPETTLAASICAHALVATPPLVIPDLTADPRTRDNPLVTGAPQLRFYAGVPLRTPEGHGLGTLCVLDHQARPEGLAADETTGLEALARQVMQQLAWRRLLAEQNRLLREHQATDVQDAATPLEGELDPPGLTQVGEAAVRLARIDSEARYKAVFDSAIDFAIIVMGQDGRVTEWNVGARQILGWTPDEMIGQPADRIFTPEDRAAGIPAAEMRNVQAASRSLDERWHLRKGGERFFANGEMMALRDADGASIGYLKILRDRTGQRHSLEQLQASEHRLRLERGLLQGILQQAPVGISIAYGDGQAMFNDTAQRMLGHSVLRSGDDRYTEFHATHPDGSPYDVADYPTIRALRHGETVRDELMHYRGAGQAQIRRWTVSSTPVRDADGPIAAAITVFADIEDRLQAEQALRDSEERLSLAFAASGSLGWYDWDVTKDRLYAGEHFARMFGVDALMAERGAPIADYMGGIHPDDRAGVGRQLEEMLAAGTTFDAEYRLLGHDGVITWVHSVGRLHRDDEGRPQRLSGILLDVTPSRLAHARQHAMLELGERLRECRSLPEMTRAAAEIVGRALQVTRAGYGRLDAATEHIEIEPDWTADGMSSIAGRHRFEDYGDIRQDLLRGMPLIIDDVRTDPRTASDPSAMLAVHIAALVNMPVREHGRTVALFIVQDDKPHAWSKEELTFLRTVADRLEASLARLRSEDQQQLINHELSHRLKNVLAMSQAIATQTLRNATTLEGAKEALTERLMALGKAQDTLMEAQGMGADIRAIITDALHLHDDRQDGRFTLEGPPIQVAARAALSLALMMHELATNAAKYGALSVAEGRVSIRWSVSGASAQERLELTWEEQGGPPVSPPRQKGFGSRLIERGLTGAVGGEIRLNYRPEGVLCVLTAPLSGFQARD